MIEIKEVTNEKALKTFVKFPIRLYKKNPYYVPFLFSEEYETLKKDTNPAFDYCESKYWIAYDNGKIVGRIAAIINYSYIEKWGVKSGRFGYVDFINNFKVAEELFKTAEKWLKSKGMDYIQGPLGFCDLDPAGMLVDGFNKFGTLTTIYNDNYYMDFIEKLGYEKEVD